MGRGGKRLPGSGTVCGTCTVHVSKFLFAQHSTEKGAADKLPGGWTDGRAVDRSRFCCGT